MGSYQDGLKNGYGEYFWANGSKYKGNWSENKISGYGEYFWNDERSYKGEWMDNNMHGKGVYKWPDGRKYDGEYVNEKKHGLNKMDLMPAYIQEVIKALNQPDTVDFISRLTGIPNLRADHSLEGGGLHQTCRGGFLNVHADFTVHPHKRHWRRRVNLLLYLNEGWEESYNGHLELDGASPERPLRRWRDRQGGLILR